MKNIVERLAVGIVSVIACTSALFAQNHSNTGKPVYTYDEVRQMCGVPVDSILVRSVRHRNDFNGKSNPVSKGEKYAPHSLGTASSISWRNYMSPVEYQGDHQCTGDCWIHAATGVLEGMLHIALYGQPPDAQHPAINLDESEVLLNYYPNASGNTCGGMPAEAFDYIYSNRIRSVPGSMPNLSGVKWGIVSESDMYNQADIKNALASGPVSAQFMVYQDFVDFFNNPANRYSAYHENGTRLHGVGHAVVIVGYDDATSSWLCKNSWGSAWADGGYFRIGYGDGTGIDESESSEVTVNSSCFAKIVPNIIGSLGTATGYAFGTNEWAYAINNASSGGNVSIPTGKVLTINPGKTITFSNGDLLTVNGTLQAVGTSSQPITFDRSGTSGSWSGIIFNSGSSGSMSYCTIHHASTAVTTTGIIPTIQNCTISNNTNGIWVSGAGKIPTAPMAYNTIQYNTGYGIYLNQSSLCYVHHNNISYNHNASNNAVGIYCYSASAPYLSYDVLTNNDIALSCTNSPAWLITYATPPGQDVIKSNLGGILAVTSNVFLNYSNSSIYQNTNYAISEQFYSAVSAQYNYWHRENSPNCVLASDFLTYRGGSISHTPALCTDPNPMGKIAVGGSIAESPVLSSETTGSNSSTGPGFFDSELLAALDAMVLHNYEKAIAIYLPRFKKETDSAKRIYVLQQLAECYRASGES